MVNRRLDFVLGLALLAGCATSPRPSPQSVTIEAELTDGDPALLVFATVWCEACKREAPEVRAWLEADPGRKVAYVVSGSPRPRVEAFAEALGLEHARLAVVVDADGAVARCYGVRATPTLFLHPKGGPRAAPVHSVADLP